MNCPTLTGGFFQKNEYTLKQRMKLYYGVCVILRLLIASAILIVTFMPSIKGNTYEYDEYMYHLFITTLVLSLLYFFGNLYFYYKRPCVWWSRRFHILIALILIIISSFVIHKREFPQLYPVHKANRTTYIDVVRISYPIYGIVIGLLLLIDVLGPMIFQSFRVFNIITN